MEPIIQQLAMVFDHVQQPIIFLENGAPVYHNDGAEPLLPFLTSALLSSLSDGCLSLGNHSWEVNIQPLDSIQIVFFHSAEPSNSLPVQLLDVVAQSMRTPLTTTMIVSQMLLPRLGSSPRNQQEASSLNRSLYQLLRLSSNLSDLSHLLRGEMRIHRRRVDAVKWLSELGDQLASLCRFCGVTIKVDVPSTPCDVWMDADLVQRAILNLVSNALKYAKEGGIISVSLEIGRQQIHLKVQDDGEGIDPQLLATLYDRWRDHDPLGDSRWGAGLGLPIVRQIAALHGGTVLAQPRPGGGTCVTLSLDITDRSSDDVPILCSPQMEYKHSGGFDPILVELSDVLPAAAFEPVRTNE